MRIRRMGVAVLTAGILALGCGGEAPESSSTAGTPAPDEAQQLRARLDPEALADQRARIVRIPDVQNMSSGSNSPGWDEADWNVLRERLRWADGAGLDTLAFGSAVAEMGRTFVGWTYTPQTLEAEGPERVVVNLLEFDCVTFIENVLALVRLQREAAAGALTARREETQLRYEALLTEIRYRNGGLAGYPSRLHYFSEWLSDNADRGLLALRTAELSDARDPEPIDFMSTHPDAYRQLSDPAVVAEIAAHESRLSASPRAWIPQESIADIEAQIREGDVIAATSTVAGLDIAHTGIAVRIDGRIHLMHAPLVGSVVEISEVPLADRIRSLRAQDGVMVASPLAGDR